STSCRSCGAGMQKVNSMKVRSRSSARRPMLERQHCWRRAKCACRRHVPIFLSDQPQPNPGIRLHLEPAAQPDGREKGDWEIWPPSPHTSAIASPKASEPPYTLSHPIAASTEDAHPASRKSEIAPASA